jgi:hypothetical protein
LEDSTIIESSPTVKPTIPLTSTPQNNLDLPPNTPELDNESLENNLTSLPIQIASGNVWKLWWSDDSKILYFGIAYEGDFAYDLQNQSITTLSIDDVSSQTPQIELLDQLPPYDYNSLHVSPSRTRAIYIRQEDIPPVATRDDSIEGGEQLIPSHNIEMWLWQNGTAYSLGVIKQCQLTQSFWSSSEQEVVLVEFGIPIPVCLDSTISPQAWLLNLEEKTSYPLFSRTENPPLQVYGFSPDGKRLLYGFYADRTGANLSLLDIETFNFASINAPVDNFLQWVNDTKILIEYRNDTETPPYPVGILDLQSLQFCDLLPMFKGKYVRHAVRTTNGFTRRWTNWSLIPTAKTSRTPASPSMPTQWISCGFFSPPTAAPRT